MVAVYFGFSAEFTLAMVGLVISIHHADPVVVSMPRHSAHCSSIPLEVSFPSVGHERNAFSVASSDKSIDPLFAEFGVFSDRLLLEHVVSSFLSSTV